MPLTCHLSVIFPPKNISKQLHGYISLTVSCKSLAIIKLGSQCNANSKIGEMETEAIARSTHQFCMFVEGKGFSTQISKWGELLSPAPSSFTSLMTHSRLLSPPAHQHAVLMSRNSHSDYVVVILSALCFPVSVDPKAGGALGAVQKTGSGLALPLTRARSRTDGVY